jgi:hypothetical protein
MRAPGRPVALKTVMITVRDVERFIPIVKPLFDGLRSVRDLWDFFRTLRRGPHRPEHSRGEAAQGLDTRNNTLRSSRGQKNGSSMEPHSIYDPEHWRRRAEEACNFADSLDDPDAKRTMRTTAEEYEHLAERAAQRTIAKG